MDRGPWTQTYSGKQFFPLDPDVEDLDIEDIAHSLSMICRFNGHCRAFYSVAQHSVLVSQVCEETSLAAARWGLLHDAAEAYVGDVVRPIKAILEDFQMVEEHLANVVARRFFADHSAEVQAAVRLADDQLLATELDQLMSTPPHPWLLTCAPLTIPIDPMSPDVAKALFLARFHELFAG